MQRTKATGVDKAALPIVLWVGRLKKGCETQRMGEVSVVRTGWTGWGQGYRTVFTTPATALQAENHEK